MATTKTEETVKIEKKAIDPWKVMKRIRLPKATNGEPNYSIASVNGRVFKIKRGIEVDVPAPIAEVIENSFDMQDKADEYIESKASV